MSLRQRVARLHEWMDACGWDGFVPGDRAARFAIFIAAVLVLALLLCVQICGETSRPY